MCVYVSCVIIFQLRSCISAIVKEKNITFVSSILTVLAAIVIFFNTCTNCVKSVKENK